MEIKYILTFIDDYSRMCWVYLLKEKSQVFYMFKTFHAMVTNENQQNIGISRTDNGGEYTSKAFEQYLTNNDIKHQLVFHIIHTKIVLWKGRIRLCLTWLDQ